MGEGGIKGGAVDCPEIPEHTSRQQTSNCDVEGVSRGAGDAQEEDEGNNANDVRKHCQREPGRDRGGGATRREMMENDDGGQQWTMTNNDRYT